VKYFDLTKTLGHNCRVNFVIGGWHIGKTSSFMAWAFRSWQKSGKQFMYVRRRPPELAGRSALFDDLEFCSEFHGWEVRTDGMKFDCRKIIPADADPDWIKEQPDFEWQTFGFAVALSQHTAVKGVPFPNVDKILFDEFMLENREQKYMPDEPRHLMRLVDTVDRGRGKVRLICFANSADLGCPHLAAAGLSENFKPGDSRIVDGHYWSWELPQTSKEAATNELEMYSAGWGWLGTLSSHQVVENFEGTAGPSFWGDHTHCETRIGSDGTMWLTLGEGGEKIFASRPGIRGAIYAPFAAARVRQWYWKGGLRFATSSLREKFLRDWSL